jgi:hypothetical protein
MQLNWKASGTLRILDWDIENRPLTYLGQDFTTAEITAIACGWIGEKRVYCWLLGEKTMVEMLEGFMKFYNAADVVTGHYIRRHDLPILNGALIEQGLPSLTIKMTSDTKTDLVKRAGISASQESLSGMLGLSEPKVDMSQTDWREANRLTPAGLALTKKRVKGDIRQHRALRAKMVEQGILGPPRLWYP